MSDQNHPLIQKALDSIGASDEDNRPAMYASVVAESALYSPAQREAAMAAVEQAIHDDANNYEDGHFKRPGSLRLRSQLVSLHRHMSDAHWKLKASGR